MQRRGSGELKRKEGSRETDGINQTYRMGGGKRGDEEGLLETWESDCGALRFSAGSGLEVLLFWFESEAQLSKSD